MELIPAHLLRYCSLLSLGSLPAGAKFWLGRATPMCSVYRRHGLPCEDILLLQRDCRCFRTSRHDDSKSLHIPFAVRSCSIAATTRDEALRIAANITSCPELLRAQTDLGTAKESGVAELAVRAMRQHTPEPRHGPGPLCPLTQRNPRPHGGSLSDLFAALRRRFSLLNN
jgi:hypothetical protein